MSTTIDNNKRPEFGPEYLLVFVGYSSDASAAADAIVDLEAGLQRELDKLRRVNPSVPFVRIRLWKWDSDAAAVVGGQAATITPLLKRADAAVFVFGERVGPVAWEELNYARKRKPSIPVLPFFPARPPSEDRLMQESVAEGWSDLLKKRQLLSSGWVDPDSHAVMPLPYYQDLKTLGKLVEERLVAELVRLASAYATTSRAAALGAPVRPSGNAEVLSSLLLGYSGDRGGSESEELITSSAGNVLSIAPSGDGRYSATVAPTLQAYGGMGLVLDPTGRIYESTAAAREAVGPVVKLDPWGLVGDARVGSLNPMDIVMGLGMSLNDAARCLAEFLVPYRLYQYRRRDRMVNDPFWPNMQRKLLVGLIMLAASESRDYKAVFSRIRSILIGDDSIYNLAVKLDESKKAEIAKQMDAEAYQEIAAFLQEPDLTRSGILAGVSQHFGAFGSLGAQRSTDTSSFDVSLWIRGEPVTIYVLGPPAGVEAFDSIYRLWLGTLLIPILQRPSERDRPTLIVLDVNEAFEVWPGISTAITQRRDCQVWTIVSDVSDIEWAFEGFAESVLNSFTIIQALRPKNYRAAARIAELFNLSPPKLMEMDHSQVLTIVDGGEARYLQRLDR